MDFSCLIFLLFLRFIWSFKSFFTLDIFLLNTFQIDNLQTMTNKAIVALSCYYFWLDYCKIKANIVVNTLFYYSLGKFNKKNILGPHIFKPYSHILSLTFLSSVFTYSSLYVFKFCFYFLSFTFLNYIFIYSRLHNFELCFHVWALYF